MSKFKTSTENLKRLTDALSKNQDLSKQYYDESKLLKLSQDIFNTFRDYVYKNNQVLTNWQTVSIDVRKKFITDILNLLLENFPSKEKPEIHFLPKIQNLSAAFFDKNFTPRYTDMAIQTLGSDKPAFIFTGDLSDNGMIGQIVHEFTHYLQSIGKSTIPLNVLKLAYSIYFTPFDSNNTDEPKTLINEIFKSTIIEQEPQYTSAYAKQQTFLILKSLQNSHPGNQ